MNREVTPVCRCDGIKHDEGGGWHREITPERCLFPEALRHIEALLSASSWVGSNVNVAAQKFVDGVKGEGK